jgi:hypothetical protein
MTNRLSGHTLNRRQVISPDRQWAVFDSRNEDTQIGTTRSIERVHLNTGECQVIYETPFASEYGPGVGAAAYHPTLDRVIFLHGLFNCDALRPYGMARRFGAVVDVGCSSVQAAEFRTIQNALPFGALSGGTHAHSWSPSGQRVSFTYNDALRPGLPRTIGFMTPLPSLCQRLRESSTFREQANNDPETFCGLWASFVMKLPMLVRQVGDNLDWEDHEVATRRVSKGRMTGNLLAYASGYDQRQLQATALDCDLIQAVEECWLNDDTLVFLGTLRSPRDQSITIQEIFLARLPSDVELQANGETNPFEVEQVTFLGDRKHPGVSGPRHWLVGDTSGRRVFFLLKDDRGVVQLARVDVFEKNVEVLTALEESIEGQVACDAVGERVSFVSGGKIHVLELASGRIDVWTETRWEDSRSVAINSPPFEGSYVGAVHFVDQRRLLVNRYVGSSAGRFLQILQLEAD